MLDCSTCVHTRTSVNGAPCCDCTESSGRYANVHDVLDAYRTALAASGIPAQARLDEKGPPLRITVERAREIMGTMEEDKKETDQA